MIETYFPVPSISPTWPPMTHTDRYATASPTTNAATNATKTMAQ